MSPSSLFIMNINMTDVFCCGDKVLKQRLHHCKKNVFNPYIKVTLCLFVSVCWYRRISLSAEPILFTLTMKPIKRKTFKYFRDKYHYPSQDEFALEKTPLPTNIIFYFFIYNLKWEVATYSHFHQVPLEASRGIAAST